MTEHDERLNAEIQMERRADNRMEKLLHGHAEGFALALRACDDPLFDLLRARFGSESIFRISFLEPCRVEHPHSAFLRKPSECQGKQTVQTTLFAPGGKLTEERTADGTACECYIKKPGDFETLRGFLRDVQLVPGRCAAKEGVTPVAAAGLTPQREMETRWAGMDMTAWALTAQDESAASCLRKLERQLHRRCEEAAKRGCRAAVLRDMAALPLPETYMLFAGRHIEWMRHNGLTPYVEVAGPNEPLLLALHAARAGARVDIANPALSAEDFRPPEGMRFLFDCTAGALGGLDREALKAMAGQCGAAVFLLDCFGAAAEDVIPSIERLLERYPSAN